MGLLTACGGLKNEIAGVWTDGQSTMEFKEDGSLNFMTPLGSTDGYWKVIDESHIDLQFSGFLMSFSSGRYEVNIEDDMLTVIGVGGGFSMRRFN